MANIYKLIEEVPVWQKAHSLALGVYKVTKSFPTIEIYGLTSQTRRSVSSIPANITEGFYRNSTKELIQFLFNARGSLGEMVYHLKLSKDLGYLKDRDHLLLLESCNEVGRQLNGWIKSLKNKLINHKPLVINH